MPVKRAVRAHFSLRIAAAAARRGSEKSGFVQSARGNDVIGRECAREERLTDAACLLADA